MPSRGRAKSRATRSRARKAGYKSDFELRIAEQIEDETGEGAEYEPWSVEYISTHKYTPDFVLPNGIIIEAKGVWDGSDRTKHLLVREQHPELDIRFVFMRNQPLVTRRRKKARVRVAKTYADWCEDNGFLYAVGSIPEEWYNE
jgi:hypothetical protein